MKTTHKLNIEVSVTFDNWDEDKKITKKELIKKTKDFISDYYPMKQTVLGIDSGELKINFNKITNVQRK